MVCFIMTCAHLMRYDVHNFGPGSALFGQLSPRNEIHLCPLYKLSQLRDPINRVARSSRVLVQCSSSSSCFY